MTRDILFHSRISDVNQMPQDTQTHEREDERSALRWKEESGREDSSQINFEAAFLLKDTFRFF